MTGNNILREIQSVLLKDEIMIFKTNWTTLYQFRPIGKPILLFEYSSKEERFFGPDPKKISIKDRLIISNKYKTTQKVAFIIIDISQPSFLKIIETKIENVKAIIDTSKQFNISVGFENGVVFATLPPSKGRETFKDKICIFHSFHNWTKQEKQLVNKIRNYHLPMEFKINNIPKEDKKRDYTGALTYLKYHYDYKKILTVKELLEKLKKKTWNRFDLMDFD